jgi:2-keto-3-deoxy-L-rhamnonate aldolase RhmA
VAETINRVLKAGKKHGVPAGIWGGSVENVKKYAAQGFQFITLGEDLDYILKAQEDYEKIREIV